MAAQTLKQSSAQSAAIRPTKKQRELLSYIEQFIGEHGYSPSYREIMNGLQYTSVATVSLHVTSLIRRGHLRKRDRSARSLEIVATTEKQSANPGFADTGSSVLPGEEKWLVGKVAQHFKAVESALAARQAVSTEALAELDVLVSALRVLGFEAAASGFAAHLNALRKQAAL